MKTGIYNSFILAAVSMALHCNIANAAEAPGENAMVRVYLPREVTVAESVLTLGQIGIICGDDDLAVRANEIAIGKISLPGQKVVIDKPTVLSRLACSGIPASQVTVSGAQQTIVTKENRLVTAGDLIETALAFLKENKSFESACQFTPVKNPKAFTLAAGSDVKIYPVLVQKTANMVTVHLMQSENGTEKFIDDVMFRLGYACRQAKAIAEIAAGATITEENVKMEQAFSDAPEPADWRPPYGMVARRNLASGSIITEPMVGPAKPQIVVKRNQNVIIRIENSGLVVTAMGKALQEARSGEYIKVLNIDSHREIFARVHDDATVEPIF
jgi:flagella basal body P-ring formation protein FlgA